MLRIALLLILVACGGSQTPSGTKPERQSCESNDDCPTGHECDTCPTDPSCPECDVCGPPVCRPT